MEPFWITIQIVAGILSPIIAGGLIYLLIAIVARFKTVYEHRAEEERKKPPYDEIESSMSFHDDALHIRLVKDGSVVFEDKVSRAELESRR